MNTAQAWHLLGLAPTEDEAVVKRAYAARLKLIDPDSELDEFLELRSAFELARVACRRVARSRTAKANKSIRLPSPEDETTVDKVLPAEATSQASNVSRPASQDISNPTEIHPWVVARGPERKVRAASAGRKETSVFRREIQLCLADASKDPSAQINLIEAVRGLLSSTHMEELDLAAEVEDWLGNTLSLSIPRSDPAIPLAISHFGWDRQAGRLTQARWLPRLVARAEVLSRLSELADPSNKWHAAFQRLNEPAAPQLSFVEVVRFRSGVAQLLDVLRTHDAAVIGWLNPDTLEYWKSAIGRRALATLAPADGISWYAWLVIGWVLLNIVRLFL